LTFRKRRELFEIFWGFFPWLEGLPHAVGALPYKAPTATPPSTRQKNKREKGKVKK
jgi:hypothetical protein